MEGTGREKGNITLIDRNRTVDFLKGICILLVIFTHYSWTEAERLKYLFPFWVDMAVPIFMILSGFVASKSFYRHNIDGLEKAYGWEPVCGKAIRYTLPFLFAFLAEELIFMLYHVRHGFKKCLLLFLNGGQGPGSYYYPCMMQFIFWFPVLYFIVKRYQEKGVLLCGVMNFVFELLKKAYGMNEDCYRMLLFRYTLLIAWGCYLAVSEKRERRYVSILSICVSAIYILFFVYFKHVPIITDYWTNTSFVAVLFLLPVSRILLQNGSLKCKPLERIGRASYHIFLTQMVYFTFVYSFYEVVTDRFLQIGLNFLVCITIGILFYLIEKPITRYLQSLLFCLGRSRKN